MEELLDLQADIIDRFWDIYYRTEVLRGYCESLDGEKVSSTMLYTLLEEVCKMQKTLIEDFDTKSTNIAHNLI